MGRQVVGGEDAEKWEPAYTAGVNVKQCSCFGKKTAWQFLKWFNRESPFDPAILLLGKYPREMKTKVNTKTCT